MINKIFSPLVFAKKKAMTVTCPTCFANINEKCKGEKDNIFHLTRYVAVGVDLSIFNKD